MYWFSTLNGFNVFLSHETLNMKNFVFEVKMTQAYLTKSLGLGLNPLTDTTFLSAAYAYVFRLEKLDENFIFLSSSFYFTQRNLTYSIIKKCDISNSVLLFTCIVNLKYIVKTLIYLILLSQILYQLNTINNALV